MIKFFRSMHSLWMTCNKWLRWLELMKNPVNLVIKLWNSYLHKLKNKFTIRYR